LGPAARPVHSSVAWVGFQLVKCGCGRKGLAAHPIPTHVSLSPNLHSRVLSPNPHGSSPNSSNPRPIPTPLAASSRPSLFLGSNGAKPATRRLLLFPRAPEQARTRGAGWRPRRGRQVTVVRGVCAAGCCCAPPLHPLIEAKDDMAPATCAATLSPTRAPVVSITRSRSGRRPPFVSCSR
jgi:hypothetical protein